MDLRLKTDTHTASASV